MRVDLNPLAALLAAGAAYVVLEEALDGPDDE